jgi:drug/metabolite transporter (DMT)-like permease
VSQLAILLVLTSAVLHVAWNAAGKRQQPSAAFFLIALSTALIAMLPLLCANATLLPTIPSRVFIMILGAGLFQALYYVMLAAAYRTGDMSLVYPLTRSLTVLLIAIVAAITRLSLPTSLCYLTGVALISVGSVVLPVRNTRDLHIGHFITHAGICAVLAAAGTTGCMLFDERALQVIAADSQLSNTEAMMIYSPLQSISAVFWISIYVLARRSERREVSTILKTCKMRAAIVGIGMYASYGFLLASRPYVKDLSYSVALRQLSIPLGAAIGVMLLKEPRYLLKGVGAAAITGGVVLIALSK